MKQQTSLHFYFLHKVPITRFPRDAQTPHIPRRKPALYYYYREYFTRLVIFQSYLYRLNRRVNHVNFFLHILQMYLK